MGAFHQTRLSFMRALLRRLRQEHWRFSRPLWRIDERGEGVAVYRAAGPSGYSSSTRSRAGPSSPPPETRAELRPEVGIWTGSVSASRALTPRTPRL